MCDNCGCGENGGGYTIINPADHSHTHDYSHDHHHHHDQGHAAHEHPHPHDHSHEQGHQRISIETDVLQQNNLLAQRNRGYFEAKKITALNLVSSPGSGKTTLLERTIKTLEGHQAYVIEGDQQTSLDADRIMATGVPVLQINTGNGCHLDAGMINKAVKTLDPAQNSLLLIENVGNLVCPALFDLGEQYRVVIISVTEGDDKPLKYPNMFQSAHLCLINKTDLIPYVDFDLEKFRNNAAKVNPHLQFISLSAKTGAGFEEWLRWLHQSSHSRQ
ncbi:MAG: hydrogenase nickel incorporation protein HypB [Bacteroidales bacterium]|nr:hydrogenase nickel incorporation protein HypB [Bacteroidales bacterium]